MLHKRVTFDALGYLFETYTALCPPKRWFLPFFPQLQLLEQVFSQHYSPKGIKTQYSYESIVKLYHCWLFILWYVWYISILFYYIYLQLVICLVLIRVYLHPTVVVDRWLQWLGTWLHVLHLQTLWYWCHSENIRTTTGL